MYFLVMGGLAFACSSLDEPNGGGTTTGTTGTSGNGGQTGSTSSTAATTASSSTTTSVSTTSGSTTGGGAGSGGAAGRGGGTGSGVGGGTGGKGGTAGGGGAAGTSGGPDAGARTCKGGVTGMCPPPYSFTGGIEALCKVYCDCMAGPCKDYMPMDCMNTCIAQADKWDLCCRINKCQTRPCDYMDQFIGDCKAAVGIQACLDR